MYPTTAASPLVMDLAIEDFNLQADQAGLMGLNVAPAVEVGMIAGSYPRTKAENLLKDQDTNRNFDSTYKQTNADWDWIGYSCKENGIEEPVDDRMVAAWGSYVSIQTQAAARCRDAVIRNHTKRVYTLAQASATAGTVVGGTKITARSTFDFAGLLDTERNAMRNATGITPNAILIDYEAYLEVRDNAGLRDRAWKTNVADPQTKMRPLSGAQLLASILDVDFVFVNGGMKNTANELKAATFSALWPRGSMLVFRVETSPDTRKPQFMRTFHWGADGSKIGGVFEEYYSDAKRSTQIRNRMDTDEQVINAQLGRLVTSMF